VAVARTGRGRNFYEAGDHPADLPQNALTRLGGTPHLLLGRLAAPNGTRIRTLVQVIGADLPCISRDLANVSQLRFQPP
jgi:hypothetical protein